MGWKPVSRGTVKAQLSSELILSHSFCFPSRPCGDMSRSPSEVETSLPPQQQQHPHPRVLAPRFPLSWCCSPGSLGFPSTSLLTRRDAEARREPSLAKGPWPCCGSGGRAGVRCRWRLCSLLRGVGVDQSVAVQPGPGHAQPWLLRVGRLTVRAACGLLAAGGVLCQQLQRCPSLSASLPLLLVSLLKGAGPHGG